MCLHFQNIILPEAIQTALEPSVIEMVAKLDRIIARCGVPLEKLMSDLDANISNLILKSQVSVENIFSLLLDVCYNNIGSYVNKYDFIAVMLTNIPQERIYQSMFELICRS